MTVMNTVVRQRQRQTFLFRWTPLRRAGDHWVLQPKLEAVQVDIDVGGNKIEFDSTQRVEASGPLADFYKTLVGSTFKVTLDDEGQVREVQGADALLGKIKSSEPSLAWVVEQVLGDAALRQWAEQSLSGLPDETVRPGDCWTTSSRLHLGPTGEYKVKHRYVYRGPEGKLERITVASTLKGQPFAGGGRGLPFRVKAGDVRGQGTGTILFDRARGRVVRKEMNWTIEGKLTIGIGNQETEVRLTQTQSTKVETSDGPAHERNPSRDEDRKEIERLREENERLRRRLQAVEEALRRDAMPRE
jgi:hypothetical protein